MKAQLFGSKTLILLLAVLACGSYSANTFAQVSAPSGVAVKDESPKTVSINFNILKSDNAAGASVGVSANHPIRLKPGNNLFLISSITGELGLLNSDSSNRQPAPLSEQEYYEICSTCDYQNYKELNESPTSAGIILLPSVGVAYKDILNVGTFGGVMLLGGSKLIRPFEATIWGPYLNIKVGERLTAAGRYDVPNKMIGVGFQVK